MALLPVLENFRHAFFPNPTYCPWVPEDVACSEISMNFYLAEYILTLEPTLCGQKLVTANNEGRNIQTFRLKPGISLSPV